MFFLSPQHIHCTFCQQYLSLFLIETTHFLSEAHEVIFRNRSAKVANPRGDVRVHVCVCMSVCVRVYGLVGSLSHLPQSLPQWGTSGGGVAA